MNTKKGKVLIYSVGILLIISVLFLYNYLENKKSELENTAVFIDKNEVIEQEVKEEGQNEVIGEKKDGTLLYSNDVVNVTVPRTNHFDGGREKAEEKQDYTELLGKEPIVFEPVFPDGLFKEKKIQIDKIESYYDMKVEERIKLLKKRTNFSEEEKTEWDKIEKVNQEMSLAFGRGDYNTYLKHMYKGWREFYGVSAGAVINSGEYSEDLIEFYPERIDMKIGLAYGIYVRETVFFINKMPVESRLTDGFIMYKQDLDGNWEVYFEKPIYVNPEFEKADK